MRTLTGIGIPKYLTRPPENRYKITPSNCPTCKRTREVHLGKRTSQVRTPLVWPAPCAWLHQECVYNLCAFAH